MSKVENNVVDRFNEIYDATNQKALAFIAAKCGNMSDMQDILQETYMELYSVLSSKGVDYIENDEAFVINIAKQKIYKHYTIAQRFKSDLSLSVVINEEETNIFETELEELTLEDEICNSQLVDEIERYIAKKPQDIRRIFFLRFSLDRSIEEIATLMSLKPSSVKNKLYRTINEIRSYYSQRGEAI
ncbi:MAG: RNA polymerase sigma factor [Ruminococcus sp.]|nr:RNA polymerase sigma factor [Ruminococcus sp.]